MVPPANHGRSSTASRDRRARRLRDSECAQEPLEAMPIFGQIDRVGLAAENRYPAAREWSREIDRGLPAELDDCRNLTGDFVSFGLVAQHLSYAFTVQRFEIESVRSIKIC